MGPEWPSVFGKGGVTAGDAMAERMAGSARDLFVFDDDQAWSSGSDDAAARLAGFGDGLAGSAIWESVGWLGASLRVDEPAAAMTDGWPLAATPGARAGSRGRLWPCPPTRMGPAAPGKTDVGASAPAAPRPLTVSTPIDNGPVVAAVRADLEGGPALWPCGCRVFGPPPPRRSPSLRASLRSRPRPRASSAPAFSTLLDALSADQEALALDFVRRQRGVLRGGDAPERSDAPPPYRAMLAGLRERLHGGAVAPGVATEDDPQPARHAGVSDGRQRAARTA